MRFLAWLESLVLRSNARSAAAEMDHATQANTAKATDIAAGTEFKAGLAAYARHDFKAAIACFERVLELRHTDADAHNNLGMSYLATGQIVDALDAFTLAIHFRPCFAEAFYNQALALLRSRDFTGALRCLERALELQPDMAVAHNTLGYLLTHVTGDFDKGAAHIRKALALNPADPDVMCNYGAVLTQEGRSAEALAWCEKLLAAHPGLHEARLNRGLAQLKLGRFEAGWDDYEARKLSLGNHQPRSLPFPEWEGSPSSGGKLLIYAEQGLGDQIMFASCVPDVLAHAGECLLECAPALVPIFSRSFVGATVIAQTHDDTSLASAARAAGVTRQVAIGSLPALFRRSLHEFPGRRGYLRADSGRTDYWRGRLAALGAGLKLGISWAGGAPSTRGAARSTQLADWAPIVGRANCHFVSLQYGSMAADAVTFSRSDVAPIHDFENAIENYADTAALVAALDLVITVQTALVHLAGALDKPTWVLLPKACEWRYGEEGQTIPWYPSVRLFRQNQPGEWRSVIDTISQEISQLAGP